jgi:hypothetical protein
MNDSSRWVHQLVPTLRVRDPPQHTSLDVEAPRAFVDTCTRLSMSVPRFVRAGG